MSGFDVRVHFLNGSDPAAAERLDRLAAGIAQVLESVGSLQMGIDEIRAAQARQAAAIANIAADIQRLKERITSSLTPAQVAEIQAEAGRIAGLLEGVANDPDNPDPTV